MNTLLIKQDIKGLSIDVFHHIFRFSSFYICIPKGYILLFLSYASWLILFRNGIDDVMLFIDRAWEVPALTITP